jgi:hypothetical protein
MTLSVPAYIQSEDGNMTNYELKIVLEETLMVQKKYYHDIYLEAKSSVGAPTEI